MKKNIYLIGLFLISQISFAGTVSSSNKSTASISPSCIISATNINFGTYQSNKGDIFSSATIKTKCTNKTSYYIQNNSQGYLIEENNTKYSFPYTGRRWTRYLEGPSSSRLYYNIFLDSNYSMVFGGTDSYGNIPGYAGKTEIFLTGNGQEQTSIIYGAMAGGQFPQPGNYTATLPIEIIF